MNDQERATLRDIDRYVLEARAAHVYLDAAESIKDPAQRQRNVASARSVLAILDGVLRDAAADASIRSRVQALRDRLGDRLARTSD